MPTLDGSHASMPNNNTQDQKKGHMGGLPSELQCQIIGYLDIPSVLQMQCVSTHWRTMITSCMNLDSVMDPDRRTFLKIFNKAQASKAFIPHASKDESHRFQRRLQNNLFEISEQKPHQNSDEGYLPLSGTRTHPLIFENLPVVLEEETKSPSLHTWLSEWPRQAVMDGMWGEYRNIDRYFPNPWGEGVPYAKFPITIYDLGTGADLGTTAVVIAVLLRDRPNLFPVSPKYSPGNEFTLLVISGGGELNGHIIKAGHFGGYGFYTYSVDCIKFEDWLSIYVDALEIIKREGSFAFCGPINALGNSLRI
ncbi:uncharacterized protein K452DRAFT_298756 [Aplosporella prunicola CBS 121167]|uniref:F-box domain-containing protein n=1 Tax=Aplosporella prunicola CBS 121167 TaxID=1176127 RepID=A0A6A6BBF0_9PEZI|nr:uncharacterized protein K452DRAFT_298756 [Aplosporella prunicola CBS 121167]KAF2141376.1 hypothetical protein K452DRAFT_298756 [Aplosporella prunicola CBS 121167]